MSGGSLDYLYCKVDDAIGTIRHFRGKDTSAHLLAFATHLEKVSKALHDIEWVFSCDKSPGDEVEAVMAVISEQDVLAEVVKDAERVKAELEAVLNRAKGI